MKITVRKLRTTMQESMYGSSKLSTWALSVGLQVDIDPMTGDEFVLITDTFAMNNALPDDHDWGVERSQDDNGWTVMASPDYGTLEFETITDDMSDLDDINIDTRGY
jgi:hypothetical protein